MLSSSTWIDSRALKNAQKKYRYRNPYFDRRYRGLVKIAVVIGLLGAGILYKNRRAVESGSTPCCYLEMMMPSTATSTTSAMNWLLDIPVIPSARSTRKATKCAVRDYSRTKVGGPASAPAARRTARSAPRRKTRPATRRALSNRESCVGARSTRSASGPKITKRTSTSIAVRH